MEKLNMNRDFFRGVWKLTKGYWNSEEKWKARGLFGIVIAMNFAIVYALVLLNQWYNEFYTSLQNYDKDSFLPLIGYFSLVAFTYVALSVYSIYLRQMLQINWRKWMTKSYLDKWSQARNYYKMQVIENQTDNPDQRMTEDIRDFVELTLTLLLGFLRQITTLVAFIVILWQLSGVIALPLGSMSLEIHGYMVWICLIYAIGGTYLTTKIGNPLVRLNFDQQRLEADFRFGLIRYRENGESIAFYGGEKAENKNVEGRFSSVVKNYFSLMKYQKRLSWFVNIYGQTAIIVPIFLIVPAYFAKQIQWGGIMQTLTAFDKVQTALSFFVESYATIAQWQSVVNRLVNFTNNMEKVEQIQGETQIKPVQDNNFQVKSLDVTLPTGRVLLNNLNFNIAPGETILITGDSGCGKSTLLRAISGIWPFGEGEVQIPDGHQCFFLPQRPYLPLGSLRDALLYPQENSLVSQQEIKNVMEKCELIHFFDRVNEVDDWSRILSLGEQQRVAFARVLLAKPDIVFLDESTSALDEKTEAVMYKLLKENLPNAAILSIGHRSTLHQYHKQQLHLSGDGNWQFSMI